MATPFLPFFVARDPAIEDPGASGDAGGIDWIEVAGDPHRLDTWLGGAQLPVRVVDGAPAVRAVGIGDGRYVTFESDAADVVPNDTNRRRDIFLRGPL